MSMTDTTAGTDVEILSDLDWTPTEPCSYGDCQRDATWFALCPEDRSAETVCTEHKIELANFSPFGTLTFDGSCGHNVLLKDVLWEPYS